MEPSTEQVQQSETAYLVLGLVALGLTWLLILTILGLFMETVLVPWDVVSEAYRPPIGSWQRTLNDSFENGVAGYLTLAILFSLAYGWQAIVLIWSVRRRGDVWIAIKQAAANGVFVTLCVIMYAAALFPKSPTTVEMIDQIGYHRSIAGFIAFTISFAGLAIIQYKLAGGWWPKNIPHA